MCELSQHNKINIVTAFTLLSQETTVAMWMRMADLENTLLSSVMWLKQRSILYQGNICELNIVAFDCFNTKPTLSSDEDGGPGKHPVLERYIWSELRTFNYSHVLG